jgi:hypothetical protein
MTGSQFQEAARRVSLYGNLLMGITCAVVIVLGSLGDLWAGPLLGEFGNLLRRWLQDEGVVGLVGGLLGGVVLAPLLLIPLVPFLWMDRRFGVRCPGCRRSVTLRCRHSEVLRTGKCCLCQQFLFEPAGSRVEA